ncbi:hypothetical protein [Streptomyces sp. NPDC002566]|uniref:hypothetical protein n=1 Tax=Streptomyces sp. NPDC002566 TaxID=3364650 RepID=UPI003698A853
MHHRLFAGDFVSALRPHRPRQPKDGEVIVGEDGVPRVTLLIKIELPLPAPSLEGLALYTELQAESWRTGRPLHPWAGPNGQRHDTGQDDSPLIEGDASSLALRVIANISRWRVSLEAHRCQPNSRKCRCTKQDCLVVIDSLLGSALTEVASSLSVPLPLVTRRGVLAALVARNAAIEGDADTVDSFSRTWLGLDHPERWREAVENALLGDWVDQLGAGITDDPVVADLLQRHSRREHLQLQPLWERRVRGKQVALLSSSVSEGMTLADVLTDRRSPEAVLLSDRFADPRIDSVLGQMQVAEERLAIEWAHSKDNWGQVAAGAGRPTAYGERVRRKLKRLGARHSERAAAAPSSRKAEEA